ncbi:hypothetical protein UFOVP773_32 [uncultured Caudovirales phage]|uniref:Uncharacterized protein n=1 Tax=uncultured Caudovirales phage TaxID=2100421 RepID=A0A6J5NQ74_9CAUD|nr:hypothetical protein UFOVP773_32 [uncultured Caudovirales phage]
MSNNGGSAFPIPGSVVRNGIGNYSVTSSEGMTLRDYFAAVALGGLIAAGDNGALSDGTWTFPQLRSRVAYAYADAMLQERKK